MAAVIDVVNSRTHAYPIVWVKLAAFCELRGETIKAVRSRIDRGIWLVGKHVKVRNGRTYVNVPETDRWVEETEK